MKYCIQCGQVMPDHAPVCGRCGAAQDGSAPLPAVVTPAPQPGAAQATLDTLRITLRHERRAWKIGAILYTVSAALLLLTSLLLAIFSADAPAYNHEGLLYQLYAALYASGGLTACIPCAVVGFIMTTKCNRYLAQFDANPAAAIQRCGSVGMIVLGALFNEIALIFIIINFVRCKSNREALAQAASQPTQLPAPDIEC